jgi:TrmH family RNA methyltransferase
LSALNSISNNQLKTVRKLHRKKERYKQSCFLLEGRRAVEQVIENNALKIRNLFFDQQAELWLQEPWDAYIRKQETASVEPEEFYRITDTDNPQGVLAVVEMPEEADIKELSEEKGILLALDAVQDPGNLGTILRSATWFGSAGVLVGKGTVDPFHPKVVRSTAGATGVLPYLSGNLTEMLVQLRSKGWRILVLDRGVDSKELKGVNQDQPSVLVAGNEAHGVSDSVKEGADLSVEISDRRGRDQYLESLNVAVSVGVSLYELSRGANNEG